MRTSLRAVEKKWSIAGEIAPVILHYVKTACDGDG
jgi:hypothetical protein